MQLDYEPPRKKRWWHFTAMELLVMAAIIGMLVVILLPAFQYQGYRRSFKRASVTLPSSQ